MNLDTALGKMDGEVLSRHFTVGGGAQLKIRTAKFGEITWTLSRTEVDLMQRPNVVGSPSVQVG